MPVSQQEKFESFVALHNQEDAFVIPNPWDAGTARILTSLGFSALATTSAGYAFSVGKKDSLSDISRDEILQNAKQIVDATDLPVSADLEGGFGHLPQDCAETIKQSIETSLVGGSIEDATGNPDAPIYSMEQAVERIQASAEACANAPFLLTGRAENFLWGKPDLGDTIKRLQAYSEAGADVLYAPALPSLEAIETVCREVDKPVNVVMGLKRESYSVEALSKAGVKRISVGGSFARVALGALIDVANEILEQGSFDYSRDTIPGRDVARMIADSSPKE